MTQPETWRCQCGKLLDGDKSTCPLPIGKVCAELTPDLAWLNERWPLVIVRPAWILGNLF